MHFKRLALPFLLLALLAPGCAGTTRTPFTGSMARIDADSVNNGTKSLVVMRVSTTWGTPAETRWLNVESGELYIVTSRFAAGTQQVAQEYDMVTLPPGRYVLAYVQYSESTRSSLPFGPFDIDPSLSNVSNLGQVKLEKSGVDSDKLTSSLRSTGVARDGRTPLIAGFTLGRGEVRYLGDMTIGFGIAGTMQLPGYYPAGKVAWSTHNDLERARLSLSRENAVMGDKLQQGQVVRGSLAVRL